MQNELMQSGSTAKQQVVLILLGIDKKWVRSKENGWVDKAIMDKTKNASSTDSSEKSAKRWWQFWK